MTASFHTFGCKLNQFETEALASEFRNRGFSLVASDQPADVYVINTCTVTSKSEQKARRLIRKISREHPGSLLLVTGCYAQLNAGDLAGMAMAIAISNCRSRVTWDPSAVEVGGWVPVCFDKYYGPTE